MGYLAAGNRHFAGRCCHLNIEAMVTAQASSSASRETGVMTSMTHMGPRGHD